MGSEGIFGGTISILEKNLDLRSLRQSLIVSNVANKDTPNYKAFDLAVEKEIEKLTDTKASAALKKTDPSHFSENEMNEDSADLRYTTVSNGSAQRDDGNTVDIEREMINLAENNLMYETMAQLIQKKFEGLRVVIQGGK